jgi:hypothetical protein
MDNGGFESRHELGIFLFTMNGLLHWRNVNLPPHTKLEDHPLSASNDFIFSRFPTTRLTLCSHPLKHARGQENGWSYQPPACKGSETPTWNKYINYNRVIRNLNNQGGVIELFTRQVGFATCQHCDVNIARRGRGAGGQSTTTVLKLCRAPSCRV